MLAQATSGDWASAGVVGIIALAIVVAGLRGLWVFGWVHKADVERNAADLDRVRLERDEWKNLALRLAGVTESAASKAAEVVYEAVRRSEEERRP